MTTPRPKVVVAIPLDRSLVDQLAGYDVVHLPGGRSDDGAFQSAVSEAEGLLVSSNVAVDDAVMAAAPGLRVISTMSVGLDHIDLEAAAARNITVTITPVLNDAVADLTMTLMTMLVRRIPEAMGAVADGRWSGIPLGGDLAGKRLLVVGFGRIGQTVARRALAAGMRVSFFDRRDDVAVMVGVDRVAALADGLRDADVVSLHVDLNAETKALMSREEFVAMKPTSFLVNTARGGVVDQEALTWALAEGEIAGAALDVLRDEPPDPDDPLLKAPNVIIVPHIGSATTETRAAMARCAVDNLRMVLGHRGDPSVVTGDTARPAPGATFLHFDEIDWVGAGARATNIPEELVEAARNTAARQKRMATGEGGFYMNHSVMPAGFTVPTHVHDHDELIVVLEGGCTVLDGGPRMVANDAVVIRAGHAYGFTCGPQGMRFLTIRTGEAGFALAPG